MKERAAETTRRIPIRPMIIMGLDPGSVFTGYAAVQTSGSHDPELRLVRHGVVELSRSESFARRLALLGAELVRLFEAIRPDHVAIERVFLGKNPDSAFKLGHVRGVCLQIAAHFNSEIAEYSPASVKKMIAGSGRADKETLRFVLYQMLKVKTEARLDASDALALAVGHAQKLAVAQRLATRGMNKEVEV